MCDNIITRGPAKLPLPTTSGFLKILYSQFPLYQETLYTLFIFLYRYKGSDMKMQLLIKSPITKHLAPLYEKWWHIFYIPYLKSTNLRSMQHCTDAVGIKSAALSKFPSNCFLLQEGGQCFIFLNPLRKNITQIFARTFWRHSLPTST